MPEHKQLPARLLAVWFVGHSEVRAAPFLLKDFDFDVARLPKVDK
jgi:hypothetical protein